LLHRNPRPRSAVEDLLEAKSFGSEERKDDEEPDEESGA
jgi:hypothetical protein